MTSGRYPLERVAELRADAAVELQRALAAALALATAAEGVARTRAETVARLEEARRQARRVDAPVAGWELARQAAWAARVERDLTAARERLRAAEAEVAARHADVERARAAAAQARAEHRAVERHRDGWEDDARRRRDRLED